MRAFEKNFVPNIYENTLNNIKQIIIGEHCIYFVVDETTYTCGRYIVNLLIGPLSENKLSPPYLPACRQIGKTNHLIILIFSPNIIPTEKNPLTLNDATTHMVKTG